MILEYYVLVITIILLSINLAGLAPQRQAHGSAGSY